MDSETKAASPEATNPRSRGVSGPAPQEPPLTIDRVLEPAIEAGHTGLRPPPAVTQQAQQLADRVLELDPELLYRQLTEAFCGKNPREAMQWMHEAGLLAQLLPELEATVAFSQEGGRRHKDVWEHTKTVVWQAVPRPEVRWAAVLHDIGKVPTRRFLGGGKVTFHGHAEEGVRMFRRGPARRITFPDDVRERVELLILHHLRPGQYDGSWTDSAVRRFDRDMGEILTDLLDLGRADVTSQRPGKRKRCLRQISALSRRIRALREEDARPRPLPAGLGKTLMQALELPPGKHIGELREKLEALFAAGEIVGGQEDDYYVQIVRERDLIDGIEIRPPRGFKKP